MKIGFIGLGHMGNPMARNLLKHGHTLKVFDVMPDLVKKLADLGAETATSPATCAQGVELVITMLPSSPHVRSVYTGKGTGILNGVPPETGASTMLLPCARASIATSREVCGSMVEESISSTPGGTPLRMPVPLPV